MTDQPRDEAFSAIHWRTVIVEGLRLAAASTRDDRAAAVGRYFRALEQALAHDGGSRPSISAGQEQFREHVEDGCAYPGAEWAWLKVGDDALRYMAERGCSDNAARGRTARRLGYLERALQWVEDARAERRKRRG